MNGPVKLLLDVHIWEGLAATLQKQGFDVLHINHTPHRELEDEGVLEFAAQEERAVLTCNHRDFVPLARIWFEEGKPHAGIILSIQLSRTAYLQQTQKLLSTLSAAQLQNSVRWLQEFK
ncbi:MAG: DUF5615 family PIN-like protein [Chloroflexota bacterium]